MSDPHQQIAELEATIEKLSEAAEQCRKAKIVAKVAIGAGFVTLAALILNLIQNGAPIALVGGIAAILAGTVFYGSNRSTLQELQERIATAEMQRAGLIDTMHLRLVQSD